MLKNLFVGGAGAANVFGDLGLLLLRAGFGLGMAMGHGINKMPPPDGFVDAVGSMGMPAPAAMAWVAGVAECIGGVALALGLLTRPAALALLGAMLVAAFGFHAGDPLFSPTPPGRAKEPALLYAVPCAALLLTGAGRFSLDRLLRGAKG